MEPFSFRGRLFYVKRDDLIHPYFSGNKFRKLQALIELPASRYRRLVSYGGIQSNAMLSMSALARMKGWEFEYWVKKVPDFLRSHPMGNYAEALQLGMRIQELGHEDFMQKVAMKSDQLDEDSLFVRQGGADLIARDGVARLAEELLAWRKAQGGQTMSVVTPSGTGTTALFLRRYLPEEIGVYTVPVVGDEEDLRRQWRQLDKQAQAWPTVLPDIKWPFAKPKGEFLRVWRELEKSGIVFDLLYAPKTWSALVEAYDQLPKPIVYVHSGGVSGNGSQLARYRHLQHKER